MTIAWQRHGFGMAIAWQWHGNGIAMAMAGQWHGNGAWQWPQQDVRSVYTLQETPLQGLRGFSAPRSGRIGLAGWLLNKNVNESHNLYEQNNS